ncbi:DMT family transporter [Brevibacillus humidisoli]|uniref:DMT family transporter n=1 Tax=Brevibacillus humidisoli TaxID=2895522 RepID=UPI001E57EFFE|nr:DMT family transporter [Brevibacillus humidisoli]UFJ43100.1 DMT family transporter [Brevibacillus humidisoli]
MNGLMMLLSLVAGIGVAAQAGINGALGKKIGTIEASFISFAIGTLCLLLLVIFFGKGNLLTTLTQPKWMLLGGLLGAIYVFAMVLSVPKIGVATTLLAVIAGQIIASTVIDHFGLVGGRQIPLDWQRMLGILLLAAALLLFYRK